MDRSRFARINRNAKDCIAGAVTCVVTLALVACSTPKRLPMAPPSQMPSPAAQSRPPDTAAPKPAAPIAPVAPPPSTDAAPPAQRLDKATAFLTWIAQQERLYRVAAPILLNNTALCPEQARNLLGFTAKTKYSYSADYVEEAQTFLGLDDRLRITEVLPGSSAALAGIREGDILLAAGIEPMPEGENAEKYAAALIASELQGRTGLNLTVSRDGERVMVDVPLTQACAMAIDVGHTGEADIYADGQRVMVTTGMLNLVRSDDELAYVLARGVAHNALHPSPDTDVGTTIDRLRTPDAERHADDSGTVDVSFASSFVEETEELALYMLVRAGYDLDHATRFWQRLFSEAGSGPATSDTSPRISMIEKVAKAILVKRENGLPLVPDLPMYSEHRPGNG